MLDYPFHDPTYLREALTHASGADHRLVSNERLEFLGDAILGAIVCELLFRKFPEYLEGELTRIKSVVVSRRTCAKISRKARASTSSSSWARGWARRTRRPSSVLADVFESLIGAIYLDGGMEAAKRFIVQHIEAEIDETVDGHGGINYKSNLQQVAQRQFGETPTYLLLDEKGPDHSKCFKISAQIGRQRYAPAWGREQERRRATRGDERPEPARRRADPVRVRLIHACHRAALASASAVTLVRFVEWMAIYRRMSFSLCVPLLGLHQEGGRRERFAGRRPRGRPRGLALPVAARLRDAVLQVQPVLERPQPRPAAALRPGAGDDDAGRQRRRASQPWIAFVWLFLGSALWLARCLIDLGLARRPLSSRT